MRTRLVVVFVFSLFAMVNFSGTYAESQQKAISRNNSILSEDLKKAISIGDLEQVEAYLKAGGDVNAMTEPTPKGQTALFFSLWREKPNIAKLLIEHGADLTLRSGSDNELPISRAAAVGYKDIVETICNKVKNPNQLNEALSPAVVNSRIEIVKLLLQKGASPNSKDRYGDPVIMEGLSKMEILEILVNAGADVNLKDQNSQTLLIRAVNTGNIKLVKFLLSKGANPKIRNARGQNALDIAESRGNAEVITLLNDATNIKKKK